MSGRGGWGRFTRAGGEGGVTRMGAVGKGGRRGDVAAFAFRVGVPGVRCGSARRLLPHAPTPPRTRPTRSTGRKRRCGWFDAVVVRYAHALNGFTSLNLTKLDVLDDVEEIRVGVGYTLDGVPLAAGAFPAHLDDLARVVVQYETLPGWRSSTRGVTSFAALPPRAQAYVRRLEAIVGVPIAWIGTGAGRNDMVTRGFRHKA